MNKKDRAELQEAISTLATARGLVEGVMGRVEDRLDKMSEKAQESAKGQEEQERFNAMDTALGEIEEIEGRLEEISAEEE